MKHRMIRVLLTVGLVGASIVPAVMAEEAPKTALPTLLIKGEVVSNDTSDPSAALLKVKDRYGFETPIYLTADSKILQGDQTVASSNLAAGTNVEVEYNFDINTAKRQAVNVKVIPAASTASAIPSAATAAPAASAAPAAEAAPSQPASSEPAAAPAATQEQPASTQ